MRGSCAYEGPNSARNLAIEREYENVYDDLHARVVESEELFGHPDHALQAIVDFLREKHPYWLEEAS